MNTTLTNNNTIRLKAESYGIVDKTTGEFHDLPPGEILITGRASNQPSAGSKKQRGSEIFLARGRAKSLNPFIFLKLPDEYNVKLAADISPTNLARLTLLSTYMQYNDRPQQTEQGGSTLVAGRTIAQHPVVKRELRELLQLSDRTFYSFLTEMKSAAMLSENDNGTFTLNNKLFAHGRLPRQERTSLLTSKISIVDYRNLYSSNSKNAKFIGRVLQLTPFLNRYHNIFCKNPYESDRDKILPMTFTDICKRLNMAGSNVTKFKNVFERHAAETLFEHNGVTELFCTVVRRANGRSTISVSKNIVCFYGIGEGERKNNVDTR